MPTQQLERGHLQILPLTLGESKNKKVDLAIAPVAALDFVEGATLGDVISDSVRWKFGLRHCPLEVASQFFATYKPQKKERCFVIFESASIRLEYKVLLLKCDEQGQTSIHESEGHTSRWFYPTDKLIFELRS
jgi:hypothetical protein